MGLHLVLLIAAIASAAAWVASLVSGDTSWVDRMWSLLPETYVIVFAATSHWTNARLDVLALLTTLWGVRLTFNFARKGGYRGVEDYRWAVLRAYPIIPCSLCGSQQNLQRVQTKAMLRDCCQLLDTRGVEISAHIGAPGDYAEVARQRGHVSDASFAAVKAAGYGDAQVIEIVAHVALNTWTNLFNEVFETRLDFPAVAPQRAAA